MLAPFTHTARRGVARLFVLAVLMVTAVVLSGCPVPEVPPATSDVDLEYRRCKEQQDVGDARGCWKLFVRKYEGRAAEAQLDYAKRQAGTTAPAPTYTAPPTHTAPPPPPPTYTYRPPPPPPPPTATTNPPPAGPKAKVLVFYEWAFLLEGTDTNNFIIVNRKSLQRGVHIKLPADSNGYFYFANATGRYVCYAGTLFQKQAFSMMVPENLSLSPVGFDQEMAFGNWTIQKQGDSLKVSHVKSGTYMLLWQHSNGWVEVFNRHGKKSTIYSGINPPGIT